MITISPVIASALGGLCMGLAVMRRKREADHEGPCARYFLFQYPFALGGIFFLYAGLDALVIQQSINLLSGSILLGFSALGFLAFAHFSLFRIRVRDGHVECSRWPMRLRRLPVAELRFIGTRRREDILHFTHGQTLRIPLLISGQEDFVTSVQTYVASRLRADSYRPGKSSRGR